MEERSSQWGQWMAIVEHFHCMYIITSEICISTYYCIWYGLESLGACNVCTEMPEDVKNSNVLE